MSAIIEAFTSTSSFLSGEGVSQDRIMQAEAELRLQFSDEYREYLSLWGIAAFDGHELTGITESCRLDVVTATTKAKKRYPMLPANLYVIEETNIEEVIVLQDTTGTIYGIGPNHQLEVIDSSLSDYIKKG